MNGIGALQKESPSPLPPRVGTLTSLQDCEKRESAVEVTQATVLGE